MIELGQVFTLFVITLGPMKLLGPFAKQTRPLDAVALRDTAWRVFMISLIAVIAGGIVGKLLAASWDITLPAIELATGIVFFLVAIRIVLSAYDPAEEAAREPLPEAPMAATLRLTFPGVVTPYGIAALIALLAATDEPRRLLSIFVILVLVMVLNLLAMLYVRQIMRGVMLLVLQVLGAVLGVLQVCLSVQIFIRGLRDLQVLPPPAG